MSPALNPHRVLAIVTFWTWQAMSLRFARLSDPPERRHRALRRDVTPQEQRAPERRVIAARVGRKNRRKLTNRRRAQRDDEKHLPRRSRHPRRVGKRQTPERRPRLSQKNRVNQPTRTPREMEISWGVFRWLKRATRLQSALSLRPM